MPNIQMPNAHQNIWPFFVVALAMMAVFAAASWLLLGGAR
jgi:hypothetical protein